VDRLWPWCAAEAVQFGAALARSNAALPVAAAQAARMEQLAREGIIAPARAEEARATFSAAQATMNENRRLLALGAASADGTITLRAPIAGRVTTVGIDAGSRWAAVLHHFSSRTMRS
jgi:cobalt-zinc-cadmium efflux system membrane fusion protein